MPATTASAHRAPRNPPDPRHSAAYLAYLMSPEWQAKRRAALARANHRCQHCGKGGELDVHHKNYDWLGEEDASDLIALCRPCHDIADRRRRALGAIARNERGGY